MRQRLTLMAALAVAGTLALPAAAQDDEIGADTVVATVDGTDITLGHMIVAYASLPQQYRQLPPNVLYDGILDQLIQQQALAESREEEPGRTVTLQLENERRSLVAAEEIEEIMQEAVTDEDIAAVYEEQYAQASPGEEYNASHILVESQEEAQAIIDELEGGADFAELAQERSTGPSGPGGGELGWFGPGMMVPDFEAAVVALEEGQISEPVETQFGWHVIKLNETRMKEAPPIEEVREEIATQLRQQAVEARIEELVAASDVDRAEIENLDPSILRNLDLLEN